MNNQFLETLNSMDKTFYKVAYDFQMQHGSDKSPEAAHQAGLDEIKRINKLSKTFDKPQTYVEISTGKRIKCAEAELMQKHA